jgi:hypothetical protein
MVEADAEVAVLRDKRCQVHLVHDSSPLALALAFSDGRANNVVVDGRRL